MKTERIPHEFYDLNLHDSYLYSLDIKFHYDEIELSIVRNPEDGLLIIAISNFKNLSLSKIEKWDSIELYSVECTKDDKNTFKINFILLTGFGLADAELSFNFESMKIKYDTNLILL